MSLGKDGNKSIKLGIKPKDAIHGTRHMKQSFCLYSTAKETQSLSIITASFYGTEVLDQRLFYKVKEFPTALLFTYDYGKWIHVYREGIVQSELNRIWKSE